MFEKRFVSIKLQSLSYDIIYNKVDQRINCIVLTRYKRLLMNIKYKILKCVNIFCNTQNIINYKCM